MCQNIGGGNGIEGDGGKNMMKSRFVENKISTFPHSLVR